MKKIIITVMLVLSLIPTAFAYTDTATSPWKEDIDELTGMGIVNGYPDGTFLPDGTLTRAEMAVALVNLLGSQGEMYKSRSNELTNQFSDVDEEHYALDSIKTLTALSVVNGYENGEFRPDNKLTYAEFVKACVCVGGYSDLVESSDIWFENYIKVANQYKLTDGIEITPEKAVLSVTREDAARILLNTANTPIRVSSGMSSTPDGKMVMRYQILDGTNGKNFTTVADYYNKE